MFTLKMAGLLVGGSLLASRPATAQTQVATPKMAGYLIANQGDTLRGQLTAPRLATRHGVILYAPVQAARHFGVQELRAVRLSNGRYLVRRVLATGHNSGTGASDSATVLVEPIVAGAATLYRYDTAPDRQQAGAASEAVQYFVGLGSLAQLQPATQPALLAALLKDCPNAVSTIPQTSLAEDQLAEVVLHYNRLCHPEVATHDYRLAKNANTWQALVSLRVGGQHGQLYYDAANQLGRPEAQATTTVAVGVELRFATRGPWSIGGGLNYARLRSEATQVQLARLGTANAGQPLTLPSSVAVHLLQVPVLARYTLGRGLLQPYLAAGPMLGFYINNKTTLATTTFTNVSSPTAFNREDVAEVPIKGEALHLVVSGSVRAGLRVKTSSRFSPLLEAQYSAGRDSSFNPGLATSAGTPTDSGDLHYRSLSLVAGVEF